jgi:hypothetical protein
MIKILDIRIIEGTLRHANIIISVGDESYLWAIGGLPLEGDLQTILDGREAELWAAAQTANIAPASYQAAGLGARAWYEAHPNAALLFELPIEDLIAQIDALDLTALPAATRNALKLLLKTLSISTRVLAKREGFTQ